MKAFWTYTLARLGLFVAAFVVTGLIASIWLDVNRISVLWVLLVSLAASGVGSLFLLHGLRNQLAADVHARASRMSERIEESRSAEDID